MNDSKGIAKRRQKISERIAEINGLPAPIDESGIKPEMRKKLEEYWVKLEEEYASRQLNKSMMEKTEWLYKRAKASRNPDEIAEAEEMLDATRKAVAMETLESDDFVLIREVKELVRKIEADMQ